MKSLRSVCCVLMAVLFLAFSMAACTRDKNNGSMGSSESSMAPESSTNRRETESQMPGTGSSEDNTKESESTTRERETRESDSHGAGPAETAESSKGLLDELGDDLSSDLDRMETE